MPQKAPTPRRKIGRPPAGARAGEKVKDYPQLSVRLPADIRAKLQVLSAITEQPQWRLIIEAIECYLRDLPPAQKTKVEAMAARSNGGRGKGKRSGRP